ncbi:MAG: DUF1446 domain-containing protein [Planctomycetes bacterium]|nr:DUF1446 domain-containing protein [Planctomycetota bacterium]
MRTIRVGNGCGFWGDSLDAPLRLVQHGQLDYLTLEYLAELTLSILAHQRSRDPAAGYATDFIDVLRELLPLLRDQPQLRIITNAGGMNPMACARAAESVLREAGLTGVRIGVVSGDDLFERLPELIHRAHTFAHLDTGDLLEPILDHVVSANAYLGAKPIVDALAQGARIVITGRVADASLTVAPAIHEFGWRPDDWPRVAGATVAGHLIECGAQVTGGLYCDWPSVPDYANIGYPIAVLAEDGSFEITKPAGTGGLVNRETVIEQLLYEIGDPIDYKTPDVRANFTSLRVEETSTGVRVTEASGRPPTDSYKVSIAYRDGFMASGTLAVYESISPPDMGTKARRCGELVLQRLAAAMREPARSHIDVLGDRSSTRRTPVAVRVAVHDSDRGLVERFCRELAPLVTSGPPGITGYTGARPRPHEVLAYWPALVARAVIEPRVEIVPPDEHRSLANNG